jgi:hypothetical protein
VLRIRIGFNADPDPAFSVNADQEKNRTGVTYGLLYGNAPLWSEKANGPVVRRLELDPLLRYAAELGQRHHLKEHEVLNGAAKR